MGHNEAESLCSSRLCGSFRCCFEPQRTQRNAEDEKYIEFSVFSASLRFGYWIDNTINLRLMATVPYD